jgi:hypothetical protein
MRAPRGPWGLPVRPRPTAPSCTSGSTSQVSPGAVSHEELYGHQARVADLSRFQAAFDELAPKRQAHGLGDLGQFVSADEPETIIVLLEVEDVERARQYWHSEILAHGRQRAGVVGPIEAGTDQVWLTNGTVREAAAVRTA